MILTEVEKSILHFELLQECMGKKSICSLTEEKGR